MFGAFLDAAMSIPNNMFAEEQQNDMQQFNRAEALEQRAWTEQMSNTQYQRAATDAKSAGLNRILAMRQGGNVAGGGATASSGATSGHAQSNFAAAQVMEEQKDNLQADTTLKGTQRSYTSQLWNTSRAEEALTRERVETQREATRHEKAQADIATSDAKGRALEGDIDTTTYGNIMRYIDRAVRGVTGAGSAYQNLNR